MTGAASLPRPPRPPSDARGTGLEWELSAAQRRDFASTGFVVLPGAVAPEAVAQALRAINAAVGEALAGSGRFGQKGPHRATGLADGIGSHPAVLSLLWQSRAWGAAACLLGHGEAEAPGGAQVALRFPQPPGRESLGVSRQGPPGRWHIDGMDRGLFAPFGLLVGVLLSDTPAEDMGQLTVYPGSHLAIAKALAAGDTAWVSPGAAARKPDPEAAPLQVLGSAGTVVMAHPLLAHRVGMNYSAATRYAAFFRVRRRDHDALRPRLPDDPLCMYPGARA